MKNILFVSGHTDLNDSVANKTILKILSEQLPEAEFDYLDQLYPDFKIDIKAEQQKLETADLIILQFPVFWYTIPSLMSRWIEEVFQHGFSHGTTGDKLKGKKLIASLTTGAPEESYHKNAVMGFEIEEFLPAIKSTCRLCGIEFAGFIHTGGVSYQTRSDEKALEQTKRKSAAHAEKLLKMLKAL